MDLGNKLISTLPRRPVVAWKGIIALVAVATAALGCESTKDKTDAGVPVPSDALMLENANNYISTTTLMPPVVPTFPGDLDIDWSQLTVDMQCHDIDPTEIVKVSLLRFKENDYAKNTELLVSGELDMAALAGYIDYDTVGGETDCQLSDLTNFGTPVNLDEQYVEDPTKSYMLTFGTSDKPGVGTRAMVFLEPREDALATEVVAESACGILTFTAEFQESLVVPAGQTRIAWNNVNRDGLQNPLAFADINRVLLARYSPETPEELAADMFDLEINAQDIWEIDFGGGRSVDLTNARHLDAAGNVEQDVFFEGFDAYADTSTWLFGLMCTTCQNPSPMVLTVLEPE